MITSETFSQSVGVLLQRWPFPATSPKIEAAWKQALWNACQQLDEQKFIQAVLDLVDDKKQFGRPSPEQIRLKAGGESRFHRDEEPKPAATEAEFVARTGWTREEMRAYWHKTAMPKLAALTAKMDERSRFVMGLPKRRRQTPEDEAADVEMYESSAEWVREKEAEVQAEIQKKRERADKIAAQLGEDYAAPLRAEIRAAEKRAERFNV